MPSTTEAHHNKNGAAPKVQRKVNRRLGGVEIDAGNQDLAKVAAAAWRAILDANSPPLLFRHAGRPARIESGDAGEPVIRQVDLDRMRHRMARVAKWTRRRKVGEETVTVAASPPRDVVRDVLATPDMELPILTRIVEAPVFAPNGNLQTTPGYHAASRTYYVPASGFSVPAVSNRPTASDVSRAVALIRDDLLGDFPFVGPSEVANAIAVLLLPFARDLIQGPTPFHLIEKPSPGTGGTLLAELLAYPAIGRQVSAMTEGRDEDEWRKRLTAVLRGGSQFLLIDNLRRRLESSAVASAITSSVWEDRILSLSETVRIPVRVVWLATGNNPAVSSEIARRTVRIRLDAKIDRPWLRDGFRHPDIRGWAGEHRGELAWAALTLIRAWLVAGRPAGSIKLGMFEHWSSTMGGILAVAGIPGFLANAGEFYDESDAEGASSRAFVSAWWDKFGERLVKVGDLWALLNHEVALPLGDGGEQSQKVKLGQLLATMRDRMFDVDGDTGPRRLRLERGEQKQRAFTWRLVEPVATVGESCESGECF